MLALLAPMLGFGAYRASVYFGGAHHWRAAQRALERRDFETASAHLKKALEVWPKDVAIHLVAAQTARLLGDYRAADEHLRAYRRNKGPTDGEALEEKLRRVQDGELGEGDALLASCGDRPDAPETPWILEALIEGSLKVLDSASAQGLNFEVPRDWRARKAVDLWLRLRQNRADQAQGLVWRGRIHAHARDDAAALADFRAALEMDPEHFEARWTLANSIFPKAPEEAAEHLELLRRRRPFYPHLAQTLAAVRRSLGQTDEAARLLDEILAATPDDVGALLERGMIALDEGDSAKAEAWFRRAEKRAPNTPEVCRALSRCFHLSGRVEEARRYHDRFEQLEGDRNAKREQLYKAGPVHP